MKVSELIDFLKEQTQDMQVVCPACSEQYLLEESEIRIEDLCKPRPDGWVQNKRPNMETEKYLVFPGS